MSENKEEVMNEKSLKEQFRFYALKTFGEEGVNRMYKLQYDEMEKAFVAGASMNVVCLEESLPEDAYEALEVVQVMREAQKEYWEKQIHKLNKKSFEQARGKG